MGVKSEVITMINLRLISGLAILALSAAQPSDREESACNPAPKCDTSACTLPDCFCSGNETFGHASPPVPYSERPQIVYLTFDDALSDQASKLYYDILFGTPTNHTYSNPNGCAIRATHFVTHSYTDYSLVNKWWHYGHEIASHSITHRTNLTYWEGMTDSEWVDEMVGQRRITAQFAAIDPCNIVGTRAPFLQGGGDTMYEMLMNNKFRYDCTWPTRAYGYVDAESGLYPYTMDYASVQDCPIKPCPECSHPGLWVQPMIDLEDEWIGAVTPDQGNPCSMLDACTIIPHDDYVTSDPQQVFDMLYKNFARVYHGDKDDFGGFQEGNRAPWGLYMHAAWFFGANEWHFEGYKRFIENITSNNDVWIVPISAGVDYMQHTLGPLTNANLISFGKTSASPFGCADIENQEGIYDSQQNRCGPPKACRFPNVTLPIDGINGMERYMHICSYKSDGTKQNCPEEESYPWLETPARNPCGGNEPCANCETNTWY